MKKNYALYSTALPMFMLVLRPHMWPLLFPLNFIMTGLALYADCKVTDQEYSFRVFCKKELFSAWIAGFIGDLAGAGLLCGLCAIPAKEGGTWSLTMQAVTENPFISTNSLLVIFLSVIIAAAIKYLVNLWLAFRKTDLELKDKRMLCACIAMFSAPYTFLLPAVLLRFLA